jgi:hypothetical protein
MQQDANSAAESILDLWNLSNAQERTARRDNAARLRTLTGQQRYASCTLTACPQLSYRSRILELSALHFLTRCQEGAGSACVCSSAVTVGLGRVRLSHLRQLSRGCCGHMNSRRERSCSGAAQRRHADVRKRRSSGGSRAVEKQLASTRKAPMVGASHRAKPR